MVVIAIFSNFALVKHLHLSNKITKKNDSTKIQINFEQKKAHGDTGKNVEDIRGIAVHGAKLALWQNHPTVLLLDGNRQNNGCKRFRTLPRHR